MKDGVIKLDLHWQRAPPPNDIEELIQWRDRMRAAGLIGVYPDGTGYGNISVRAGSSFIISGSGMGVHPEANREHFTRVVAYDIGTNALSCRGPVRASSESLTHAAVYETDPSAAAVIHAHHHELWQAMLHVVPTTAMNAAYGTPEIACEVLRLFRDTRVAEMRVFALGGHRDGIVAFGESLEEAGTRLLNMRDRGAGAYRGAPGSRHPQ